jgi:hypothetical protein
MSRVLRSLALLALSASVAGAQVQEKSFSVTTRVGGMSAERAASMQTAGLVGLDTEYALNKWFGIGTTVDVARANTTKEDFVARLRYGNANTGGGDSIFYQYLGQPVNMVNLGAFGMIRAPGKRFAPFVMGGVGTYVMLLDAQINGKAKRKNEMSYTGGAGFWLKLTESAGLQFDVRAIQFQGYDREFLNPATGRAEQNTPFPEDFPAPPAAKNTALNTVFTLGFRYIPNFGGN